MAIKVELKKNIYLTSDSNGYKLAKLTGHNAKGDETWITIGYYSSIKGVTRGFVEAGIRNGSATTIKEMVQIHDELVEDVKKAFHAIH